MTRKPVTEEEAREVAEDAIFDWYVIEPGWHDELPREALDALREVIARKLLEVTREPA